MTLHRGTLIGSLGFAGLAWWLLGIESGDAGIALLIITACAALYAISRMSRGGAVHAISPGEWQAWTGAAFVLVALVYFLAHLQGFTRGGAWGNPHANRIGGNLVLLLIAWSVLTSVWKSRWTGVQEDECDRQIAAQASGAGYGAAPADKPTGATRFMIGNLLVWSLTAACLVDYVAKVLQYRRDRA